MVRVAAVGVRGNVSAVVVVDDRAGVVPEVVDAALSINCHTTGAYANKPSCAQLNLRR
eukprot:COSAG01_NODE_69818_length_260_cov_0.645963_1_plen_57_part_10